MNNWGADELTQFLDRVHSNQQGNFVKFAAPVQIMQRVNQCFSLAGKNVDTQRR